MVTKRYTVHYRQPGQWFWRKVKNVVGDGIYADQANTIPLGYRFLVCEDDTQICISLGAEVRYSPDRAKKTLDDMSKEAGFPVQRA